MAASYPPAFDGWRSRRAENGFEERYDVHDSDTSSQAIGGCGLPPWSRNLFDLRKPQRLHLRRPNLSLRIFTRPHFAHDAMTSLRAD
ncbi:MAG TPA: hypothetical protein VIF40_17900 [Methylosinus sp.]|jgi:hypothetical protein|uniref:hypothetical protein n=1 Tax=Methylosinus sp. TaxID=427 RepID=UPI002F91EE28